VFVKARQKRDSNSSRSDPTLTFRIADYPELIEWSSVGHSLIWRAGRTRRLRLYHESDALPQMLKTLIGS
jgi:hypothetical protein